jgi:hypothetical protein
MRYEDRRWGAAAIREEFSGLLGAKSSLKCVLHVLRCDKTLTHMRRLNYDIYDYRYVPGVHVKYEDTPMSVFFIG